jgi:vacuolar-type H+-ATPase subunit H
MMINNYSSWLDIMSDIQEKKDAVFLKLTKLQQKKLSAQEQINYLKQESDQILRDAKKKQAELKKEQDKLLNIAKSQERKNDTRRKILLGAWVLNKIKNDESFKHQLSDFEQFLNTESKTKANRQKDKDLFKDIL